MCPSYTQPAGDKGTAKIKDYDRRIRALEFRQGLVLPDNSVPGTPSFNTPLTAFYQSTSDGTTKAEVTLSWTTPTNTDGSEVLDAAYYEIQYQPTTVFSDQPTYAQIAALGLTYAQLNSGGYTYLTMPGASEPDQATTDWHPVVVPWNNGNTVTIKELTPGVLYNFRIRFADTATPTNLSAWSSTLTITAAADSVAPSQPAAPAVASSLIAVQVTHTLGKFSGGTYNLEADLHHLEVHASYEPAFIPSSATLLGKLVANAGMLTANIPALGSFGVSSTAGVYVKVIAVDISGNKSPASSAASATATLIDNQHITDLSADKITAGTITTQILLAGSIKTSTLGARAEIDAAGIRLYDNSNNNTANFSAADGSVVLTGTVRTNWAPNNNAAIVMDPFFTAPGAGSYPTLVFYDGINSKGPARLNATSYGVNGTGGTQTGLNSGPSATGASFNQATALLRPDGFIIKYNDQSGNKRGGYVAGDAFGAHLAMTDSSGNQISGLDLNSDGSVLLLSNLLPGNGMQVDNSGNAYFQGTGSAQIYGGPSADMFLQSGAGNGKIWLDSGGTYRLYGRFTNYEAMTSTQALMTGQQSGNFQEMDLTFGATMAGSMVALCTMQNGSGGVYVTVTAISSTGVNLRASVSANQTWNFWIFRDS
jgi:hypothetical protein